MNARPLIYESDIREADIEVAFGYLRQPVHKLRIEKGLSAELGGNP